MTFAQHLTEDRRLVILRLLEQAPDYCGNAYLLHSALPDFGHSVGLDRLQTDLAWLDEQGLAKLTTVAGVSIAQLTPRGADVAHGRATVPGVKRPLPGA
ncbi:ArsR family transcriptional regulator [Aromatoleum evansii]|uniref:VpaChn25_0724 family phage protein n=1 Tax=Aromatoleum evansii TaxID=59406 RepID=UPI00145F6B64|nr:ArsR family transcriptional regulator [Aromatoleum evansii]NMG29346.1 ArsR family transcriptional regulator [Aromatoleum evansii]